MSRTCAACNKTVYPTEELRCLEKLWHKSCFRCQECNKVLTVQNFKGFGGKPYCYAHYPHLKSCGEVTNTPEMQQVALNTKNMSKVSSIPFCEIFLLFSHKLHFQAVYNYEAAEDDEVSFIEGDEILHGEPIDEGWMFGTVRRTGQFGMLPSNYVVPIQTTSLRN
ncbi:unnamed protein product [Rodentolepis nana]|uniref:LIM zinc-binding domain-containing protein n=1 Tax=Rodentolepis nana TaxID=102285 RepID=A0A0R3TUQ8_RODNA|nr:unnamed protein product [Rodentolepis nana]